MGARALTLVTDRPEEFSTAWNGYDRAEVDAFLERTAADRKRLQADLAQLEAAIAGHDAARVQELERLTALRREVARCLENSINALHVANLLLAELPASTGEVTSPVMEAPSTAVQAETAPAETETPPARSPARTAEAARGWLSPMQRLALAGLALAAAAIVIISVAGGGSADEVPSLSNVPEAGPVAPAGIAISLTAPERPPVRPEPPAASAPSSAPAVVTTETADGPLVPPAASLVLTLTATGECWISMIVDGGEPRERLLQPTDSMTLTAQDEIVLRVGDPAALQLRINGRPAKPLGSAGRVVTARITRANALDFIAGN